MSLSKMPVYGREGVSRISLPMSLREGLIKLEISIRGREVVNFNNSMSLLKMSLFSREVNLAIVTKFTGFFWRSPIQLWVLVGPKVSVGP